MDNKEPFEFANKLYKLIIHIEKKGFVTKDTRPFLSSFRFYSYLWLARDLNLVVCDSLDGNNHQKKWILTGKGLKLAGYLNEIQKLMEGDNEA